MEVLLRFKLIIFSLALAALLLAPSIQARKMELEPSIQAKKVKVEYCDSRTKYDVKVSGASIDPNPVKRGKLATFNITATTADIISKGKMVIDVKFLGFYVHSEDHDLCEETSCPVTTGDFVISHSQVLPGITPPGSYTIRMKMLEESGSELTCVHFDFSVAWFSDEEALADS